MNFIVTLYRNGFAPQNFNADNLPEARQKMLKAQSARGATKVELSVILDCWTQTETLKSLFHNNR